MTDAEGTPDAASLLGRNLRSLRSAAGLTQAAVASATGLSTTHYAAMERGLSSSSAPANPRLSTLLALCAALSCPLSDLLRDIRPSD